MKGNSILNSLRITSALAIVAGTWAMLFEVYYFQDFSLEIYFARLALAVIATIIFLFSYRPFGSKHSTWLVHLLILSLISSFLITIFNLPETVFINSHMLSLLVFTIAIIFGWDAKNQVIVAIYYNILFAVTIFSVDEGIFHFPNLFSIVLFVSFISLLSVGVSSMIYSMRMKYFERNEEIKFLFSNAPIGICKLDLNGNVITANKHFHDLLAVSDVKSDTVKNFSNLLIQKKIITKTIERSSYQWTNLQFVNDNVENYLNISTKLLTRKSNKSFIELIVGDETEVKMAERARNHALKRLAEESERREKITQKAIEQKNQKIGLLAKINHEVRTPLNSVLSFFDLIDNDMLKSPEELKDFASSVKISAENLLQTINNFIDYAKIETGHMQVEPEYFNLADIVESVATLLKPLAASKRNEMDIDISGILTNVVRTDQNKLRQILINLIGNSNKFTTGGRIHLKISTESVNGDNFLLAEIEDNGIGIPDSKIENIFKPFKSGNNLRENEFSSGLGLAICNEFVEMLKGSIDLNSSENNGTVVKVRIPVETQPSGQLI